jgi:hypothetical protein
MNRLTGPSLAQATGAGLIRTENRSESLWVGDFRIIRDMTITSRVTLELIPATPFLEQRLLVSASLSVSSAHPALRMKSATKKARNGRAIRSA